MTTQAQRSAEEPTTRELTVQLGDQMTRLVRSEVALARAELFATARRTVLGGMMLSGAGLAGVYGGIALVAMLIAAIAMGLPLWAAALVTGVALLACAGGLALLNDRGQATVASVPTVAATSFLLDRGAERMGGVQTPQVGCPETQVGLAPTPRPT